MADRGGINININHSGLESILRDAKGSESSTDLSAALGQVQAQIAKLVTTNTDLIGSMKSIPTATEAIAVAATKIAAGNKMVYESNISEKNRQIRYSESANRSVGTVDAMKSSWGDDLSPAQAKILKLRDTVDSHIDAAGNFSSTTKEATQSLSQLNQGLRELKKTVGSGSSGGSSSINGFNVAEALTYATFLSAGKYANIGANYDIGIQGASANQLGLMTVQKDIAQRNAFSSGVTSGGATLGAIAGGIIGGPLGGIVGSAIGASLGVISSGITGSMNAHQMQNFNMQTASNTANLFGGQGGNFTVTPKATAWDKLNYYLNPFMEVNSQNAGDYGLSYNVSNRSVANFANQGQGYNALQSAGLQASGGALYNVNGAKGTYLAKVLGQMAANNPNFDISSMLGTINYLAASTPANSLADNLYNTSTNVSAIGRFTGGDLGGFLNNVSNLSQMTSMSAGDAFNFEARMTPQGPAYTSAANSLQTMPVFQQMQAAAILSITNPGTTLSEIKRNPNLLRETSKSMNVSMFGENFDVFEGLRQTALGASTAQAIDNNKLSNTPSEDSGPSPLSTPTAVQSGMNAAGKGSNQHVMIQTQNVSIISHGVDKNGNSPGEMANLQTQLDQAMRGHRYG